MIEPTRILFGAVLLGALTLSACASSGASSAGPADDEAQTEPIPEEERARLEALYRARQDSALLDVHPADVSFMTDMIAHHAQALVMSHMAPESGASPAIRTLTARIINAQRDEIRNMQRWLQDRGRPVPEVKESGEMPGMTPDMHEGMPGMLASEQLEELEEARGRTFDRLFLEYMIHHHQGAVTMVRELFGTDGAAQDDFVFKLASDIQVDQITEINRMRRMLDAMSSPGGRR